VSFTPWYSFVPLRDDEPASPAESTGVDATPQSGESGESGAPHHPTIYHGPAKKTPRREFEWRDREDVTRLTIELSRKERDAIHRFARVRGMSIRQFIRDIVDERMRDG